MVTENVAPNMVPLSAKMAPIVPSGGSDPFDPFSGKFNYYAVIFYLLLSSMQTRQATVLTEAKQISANASAQNKLNNENANIKFSILPSNANTAKINEVQDQNEQYAALRGDLQNSLITARQLAQVMMTQASTNVNLLQQDASEDTGWLQTLNTVFQVIDEMTQT